jgi:hypothetical protein
MTSELRKKLNKLNLRIIAKTEVTKMEVDSTLLEGVQKGQPEDEKIKNIKPDIKEEKSPRFTKDDQGVLWYKGKVCVPNSKELKDKIF